MQIIYLTSGPRGTGKTTFCKKVKALRPELKLVIRDELLLQQFGSTSLDPYSGDHYYAQEMLFKAISKILSISKEMNVILDYWNGFPEERMAMVKRLKYLGADQVCCWQFVIPVDTCVSWFMSKPDAKGYSESGIRHDHALYYEMAEGIQTDGFDEVCRINPCEPVDLTRIIRPAKLLGGNSDGR